jgi:hypothetical protein
MKRPIVLPLAVATALAAACYDPTHLDAVANLGDEPDPNVPQGANHRPGQPCLTCHGGDGPAESEFAVAGTLYEVRGGSKPLVSGSVIVTDAKNDSRTLRSNEAGNFFIAKSEWEPTFPLRVAIESNEIRREMVTSIGRDGGCGTCHRSAGDRSNMPGVFLRDK